MLAADRDEMTGNSVRARCTRWVRTRRHIQWKLSHLAKFIQILLRLCSCLSHYSLQFNVPTDVGDAVAIVNYVFRRREWLVFAIKNEGKRKWFSKRYPKERNKILWAIKFNEKNLRKQPTDENVDVCRCEYFIANFVHVFLSFRAPKIWSANHVRKNNAEHRRKWNKRKIHDSNKLGPYINAQNYNYTHSGHPYKRRQADRRIHASQSIQRQINKTLQADGRNGTSARKKWKKKKPKVANKNENRNVEENTQHFGRHHTLRRIRLLFFSVSVAFMCVHRHTQILSGYWSLFNSRFIHTCNSECECSIRRQRRTQCVDVGVCVCECGSRRNRSIESK